MLISGTIYRATILGAKTHARSVKRKSKQKNLKKGGSIFNFLKRDRSIYFYRTLSKRECAKRLRVLKIGELEDVILRPSNVPGYGNVGNVPYRLKNAWWYEWGYMGDGPRDTAINILFHFSGDVEFARAWALQFVEEVLAELPPRVPLAISKVFIEVWIKGKKDKKSDYSYDLPYLCPEDRAWEFGGWAAAPRPVYVD